jgi:opacity protein-like surface antigen
MKKYILISLALFATAGVNAATVNPYVSEKVSFTKIGVNKPRVHYLSNPENYFEGTDEHDNTLGNKLAIGFAVPKNSSYGSIRAEFEWGSYGLAKTEGKLIIDPRISVANKIRINTFGLNAYYDFNIDSKIVPYIGTGFGAARIKSKSDTLGLANETIDGQSVANQFFWNIGAGASYALTDKIVLDVSYRYSDLGNVSGDRVQTLSGKRYQVIQQADLILHEISFGARYSLQ